MAFDSRINVAPVLTFDALEVWLSGLMDQADLKRHIRFIKAHLVCMPTDYENYSNNSLMFLFFIVSAMDILNLDDSLNDDLKSSICDRVYRCQTEMEDPDTKLPLASFKGISLLSIRPPLKIAPSNEKYVKCGEIAMTYMALLILLILEDDLSRLKKDALIRMIQKSQMPSGCFSVSPFEKDTDMRFSYCAIGICAILDSFDAIKVPQLLSYIESCFNYDGGFAQLPGLESHSGSTFCAVAAVYIVQQHCPTYSKLATQLLDKIRSACLRWTVHRAQHHTLGGGYNGRPSKIADTCYSFWTGATIDILSNPHQNQISNTHSKTLVDVHSIRHHSLSAQDDKRGGFAKHPDAHSDILHTYFGICGWSLLNLDDTFKSIEPSFMISRSAYLKYFEKKNN